MTENIASDGGLPRRRPPPPPPPAFSETSENENYFVSVDGLAPTFVQAWFHEADADSDGRVADAEARTFFLRSGLAPAELSTIWRVVKPGSAVSAGKGLSARRFSQALRLIALVQSGAPLTPELAAAALTPESWAAAGKSQLQPPRIDPAPQNSGHFLAGGLIPDFKKITAAEATFQTPPGSLGFDNIAVGDAYGQGTPLDPAAFPPIEGPAPEDSDVDIFNLAALTKQLEVGEQIPSADSVDEETPEGGSRAKNILGRSRAMSNALQDLRSSRSFSSKSLEPPLCYELRYPPLNPKESARLSNLIAGNGSLFASPSASGGILQWAGVEDDAHEPHPGGGRRFNSKNFLQRVDASLRVTHEPLRTVPSEDGDASPAAEVALNPQGKIISCLFFDDARQMLWAGTKDGWVTGFSLAGQPSGTLLSPDEHTFLPMWQAHRVGSVDCMCVSPIGELWTGSSRGAVRVWSVGWGSSGSMIDQPNQPRARELRRAAGERAHSGPVVGIACTADGQVMWTASGRGIALWDARSGGYLGTLRQEVGVGLYVGVETPIMNSVGELSLAAYKISSGRGLGVDPADGFVLSRPTPAEYDRWMSQQEAWAAQSDRGVAEFAERLSEGAGRAVRLFGKLGARLTGGLGGSSGAATSSAHSFTSQQQVNQSAGSGSGYSTPSEAATPHEQSMTASGDALGLAATPDSSMWVAFRRGRIEKYSGAGKLLGSKQLNHGGLPCKVQTIAAVGPCLWVGCTSGVMFVLGPECVVLKAWMGHRAGIVAIGHAGTRVFTLAADGSINGWSAAIPSAMDADAIAAWQGERASTFTRESLNALAVTWNCGESKPDPGSAIFRWVHEHSYDKSLAVIALQEVEMGGTSVALAAAKNALAAKMQERGNANAQFWATSVLNALGGDRHWHAVGLRQLSGMLIIVFARNNLRAHIGEQVTASVACGMLGVGGNKGGVAIEFTLHRQRIAVVCSHFAAHQNSVDARNANYAVLARQLNFARRSWFSEDDDLVSSAAPFSSTATEYDSAALPTMPSPGERFFDADSGASSETEEDGGSDVSSFVASNTGNLDVATTTITMDQTGVMPDGLRSAAALVWLGDFNYRIDGQYEQVKELAVRGDLGPLLACDQLRREHLAGRVFRGLREAPITFPPTYKFDKGVPSPFSYDSSEKRRVPAWCDRIFYRGSVPCTPNNGEDEKNSEAGAGDVLVVAKEYGCWGDVYDSDHKPVYASLEISLPVSNAGKKREVIARLLKKFASPALTMASLVAPSKESGTAPISLAPSSVRLHAVHMPDQMVVLTNASVATLQFTVLPIGDRTAPREVEIRPARGVIEAGKYANISVRAWPGGAGAYVSGPREVRCRVILTAEYSTGGAVDSSEAVTELEFSVMVLPEFAFDDKY